MVWGYINMYNREQVPFLSHSELSDLRRKCSYLSNLVSLATRNGLRGGSRVEDGSYGRRGMMNT